VLYRRHPVRRQLSGALWRAECRTPARRVSNIRAPAVGLRGLWQPVCQPHADCRLSLKLAVDRNRADALVTK